MDTNSQVRFGGVCVPYTLGHGYGWAQGLCPRNPLAVVIYRGMWSQGIQDGLTVMRNQRVLATQKNQPPQIQALSRSWGHTAIVHFSSWVLRKKKGLNQANCCRPGQGLSEFLRCPCILQDPSTQGAGLQAEKGWLCPGHTSPPILGLTATRRTWVARHFV